MYTAVIEISVGMNDKITNKDTTLVSHNCIVQSPHMFQPPWPFPSGTAIKLIIGSTQFTHV
jgi:hypothetical protein